MPSPTEPVAGARGAPARIALVLGFLGLAGATALIARAGIGPVIDAFLAAGIGVLLGALFHIVPMLANGRGWQVLLPPRRRRDLGFFLRAVWLRQAVNNLMPVARVGGELVSIELLVRGGIRASRAVASLIVEMTMSLASQFLFTLVALALLLRRGDGGDDLVRVLVIGLGVAAILVVGFYLVQRRGIFRFLARLARRLFGDRIAAIAGDGFTLDRALRALYRRRRAMARSFLWLLIGWFAGATELAIVLFYLGEPFRYLDAVIIEGVIEAIGSAAFLVPGALGVQEGGFVAIGAVLGLPPDIALALALARRARDALVLLPALIAWQVSVGRRLLARA
ncbi:MAG: lysylphosphatidylglycerol synthase domain-containing protein [Stellaceae bacterium]